MQLGCGQYIVNDVIVTSIKDHLYVCEERIEFTNTFSIDEIFLSLQKIALSMELLQQNNITLDHLQEIVPNKEQRTIIKNLSIIKKVFLDDGLSYQFLHNNYNEYICALSLKNTCLESILDIICVSEIDSDNIIPSWKNTVSFLCSIRTNNDLINCLIESEPKMILEFESGRLSDEQRNMVFKKIFEKYTLRNIWLDVSFEKLVNIANNKVIYDYLIPFLNTDLHYVQKYNAISLLGYFTNFSNDKLKKRLISIAKNKKETNIIRAISIKTLGKLNFTSEETISKLRPLLKEESGSLTTAFFRYLTLCTQIDNYVFVVVKSIPLIRYKFNREERVPSYILIDCLKKMSNISSVLKIANYFIKNPKDLTDIRIDDYVPHLVQQVINIFDEYPKFFGKMEELLILCIKHHQKKAAIDIKEFFVQTNTIERLFDKYYNKKSKLKDMRNDHVYYRLMGLLLDEESVKKVIDDGKRNKISLDDLQSMIVGLSISNTSDYEKYKKIMIQELSLPIRETIDYNKIHIDKITDELKAYSSKDYLLSKIKIVFDGVGKESITEEDLDLTNIWDESVGAYKYENYIVWEIQGFLSQRAMTFLQVVEIIEKSDFDIYTLLRSYSVIDNNQEYELNEAQKDIIKSLCFKKYNEIEFDKCLIYKEDGFETSSLAISLWYFHLKLDIKFPEQTLLDLLSFDWLLDNTFVGTKYLEEKVDGLKVKTRIIENIRDEEIRGQVLLNHIDYCIRYHIKEVSDYLEKIAQSGKYSSDERKHALEALLSFNIDQSFLIQFVNSVELDNLFCMAVRKLFEYNNDHIIDILTDNIDNGRFPKQSSECLMEKQNIVGIKYYINQIVESKKYVVDFNNKPLLLIKTIKAINLLLKLLKECLNKNINSDDFSRLDQDIYIVMKQIALQGEDNFKLILQNIHYFIRENQTIPNINFLLIIYDEIVSAYKNQYKTQIDFRSVLDQVNRTLYIPEDDEYQNKLFTCIKLQKEIIEKNAFGSPIFILDPSATVNAANLIRLKLSRNQSQFENLLNYLHQLFYETITASEKRISGNLYKNCNELFIVLEEIRCLRHFYHHTKLSKNQVIDTVKDFFDKHGGEPNKQEDWIYIHTLIVNKLLSLLLDANTPE